MRRFVSFDGIEIAYQLWGEPTAAPPVVLHHGFIASARTNWVNPGVVGALVAAGRWVLGPDARGHGASAKPHDPASYGEPNMARDVRTLLDRYGVAQADLVGYSMGAVVAAVLATRCPQRVRRLVLSGVGAGMVELGGLDTRAMPPDAVAAVLLTDDPAEIESSPVRGVRSLADGVGADRAALAAQIRSAYAGPLPLGDISAPTLVLCGDDDPLARRPEVLADAIPGARLATVRGDHAGALRDPRYVPHLVSFLV